MAFFADLKPRGLNCDVTALNKQTGETCIE